MFNKNRWRSLKYKEDNKCPILLVESEGENIFDVLIEIGDPFGPQRQVSKNGKFCYLLRADISPYRELDKFKIPANRVPDYIKNIIGDDLSIANLKHVRILCRRVVWCGEIGE